MTTPQRKDAAAPLRILHVVGGMDRGGVETWLMHLLRHIDREQFRMDFLVHAKQRCAYDDEIEALGCQISRVPFYRRPFRYANALGVILARNGPYDVVHSHVHHYSGLVLRVAAGAAVPVRIAHSHNDTSRVARAASPLRIAYLRWMKRWIASYATAGLACSQQAGEALFHGAANRSLRWHVSHYGIDLTPYRHPVDAAALRSQLGLPPGTFVVGHVGRFAEQKNHRFLLRIMAELLKVNPNCRLLLVGDGPLRASIEQEVARAGLAASVLFAGSRPNVPELLMGAMDAFVFPSHYEGLGLALVEAQAAGLPCLVSDAIPSEAIIVKSLVQTMPLSDPPSAWARRAWAAWRSFEPVRRSDALAEVEKTAFNVRNSLSAILNIYRRCGSAAKQTVWSEAQNTTDAIDVTTRFLQVR